MSISEEKAKGLERPLVLRTYMGILVIEPYFDEMAELVVKLTATNDQAGVVAPIYLSREALDRLIEELQAIR